MSPQACRPGPADAADAAPRRRIVAGRSIGDGTHGGLAEGLIGPAASGRADAVILAAMTAELGQNPPPLSGARMSPSAGCGHGPRRGLLSGGLWVIVCGPPAGGRRTARRAVGVVAATTGCAVPGLNKTKSPGAARRGPKTASEERRAAGKRSAGTSSRPSRRRSGNEAATCSRPARNRNGSIEGEPPREDRPGRALSTGPPTVSTTGQGHRAVGPAAPVGRSPGCHWFISSAIYACVCATATSPPSRRWMIALSRIAGTALTSGAAACASTGGAPGLLPEAGSPGDASTAARAGWPGTPGTPSTWVMSRMFEVRMTRVAAAAPPSI